MKIELKRLQIVERLSEETTCFTADVWIDGKKAGYAKNTGNGGATTVHITGVERRMKVEAHGKALIPAEYKGLTEGSEWLVDQLVEAALTQRDDAKWTKKIARADLKEKAHFASLGLGAARFRHDETWYWYGYRPNADPKTAASLVAMKRGIAVDEVVVL